MRACRNTPFPQELKAQCFGSRAAGLNVPLQRPILRSLLVAVQQHSLDLLFTDGAIEELIVFEVDLNERRALREGALDERLRERVLNVLLQRATQRTRTVAAIDHR